MNGWGESWAFACLRLKGKEVNNRGAIRAYKRKCFNVGFLFTNAPSSLPNHHLLQPSFKLGFSFWVFNWSKVSLFLPNHLDLVSFLFFFSLRYRSIWLLFLSRNCFLNEEFSIFQVWYLLKEGIHNSCSWSKIHKICKFSIDLRI